MTESLGDAFPKEQKRIRKLIYQYETIGPGGRFAIAIFEDLLQRADKAVMEQDCIAMIGIFQEMQEC